MNKLRKSKINRKSNRKSYRKSKRQTLKTRNQKRNKKTLSRRKSRRIQKRKSNINKKTGGTNLHNFIMDIKNPDKLHPKNCRGKYLSNLDSRLHRYIKNILEFNRQEKFKTSHVNYNNTEQIFKVEGISSFFEKYKFKNFKNDEIDFWDIKFKQVKAVNEQELVDSKAKILFDFIVNYSFLYNIKKHFEFTKNANAITNEKSIKTYIYTTKLHPNSANVISDSNIERLLSPYGDVLNNFKKIEKSFINFYNKLDNHYLGKNLNDLADHDLQNIDEILIIIMNKIKNFNDADIKNKIYKNLDELQNTKDELNKLEEKLNSDLESGNIEVFGNNPIHEEIKKEINNKKEKIAKLNEKQHNLLDNNIKFESAEVEKIKNFNSNSLFKTFKEENGFSDKPNIEEFLKQINVSDIENQSQDVKKYLGLLYYEHFQTNTEINIKKIIALGIYSLFN